MAKCNLTILPSLVCVISTLSACSSDPVSIGEKHPQYSKSELAAYAATWDGYAEAYQFEDKTDRVRLVLDEQGNGTIRVGDRDLIAAATSPTAYYPPQTGVNDWGEYVTQKFWSGFEYTARNTRIESERIRLSASMGDLFASYCALQTPYPVLIDPTATRYNCLPYSMLINVADATATPGTCIVPSTTTNSSWTRGEPTVEVNCEQLAMCNDMSRGCVCDATACGVDTSNPDLSIDAALDDAQQTLQGTLLLDGQRIAIRLQRQ